MLLYWIDRSSLSGTRAIIDVMSLLYYIDIILVNGSERSCLSRSKLVKTPKSKPERERERERERGRFMRQIMRTVDTQSCNINQAVAVPRNAMFSKDWKHISGTNRFI